MRLARDMRRAIAVRLLYPSSDMQTLLRLRDMRLFDFDDNDMLHIRRVAVVDYYIKNKVAQSPTAGLLYNHS